MIMEIWKDVVGYEGLYQVSNMGRVKSLNYGRERILKASDNGSGYLYVALCKKGKYKNFLVHRLVAMVFISNPENKPCIDHIDTNKRNNKVENLRWVTHEENMNNSLSKKHVSENHGQAKGIYCGGKIFPSVSACAKHYGENRTTMSAWLRGQNSMPQKYIDLGLRYI